MSTTPHPTSYRGNPEKTERRRRVADHWRRNPAATCAEVAAVFGINPKTAGDMKPHDVRELSRSSTTSLIREAWERKALKLHRANTPIEEIAAATGRSVATIARCIRQNTTTPEAPTPAPTQPPHLPPPPASAWIDD